MSPQELTAQEAARWALREGLPLEPARHADVAATAHHIRTVIGTLRELDFGDTPPAAVYTAGQEADDASL
ncbi:hypothetical protein [Streptomyces lydicus]|uniref:hypothetical protein n=1 Tax=Streptomyces lydicus TaxID=47763 RepID=UPI0036FC0644